MKRFYLTTAIDYVNGSPHLGHAYEKVLADWRSVAEEYRYGDGVLEKILYGNAERYFAPR